MSPVRKRRGDREASSRDGSWTSPGDQSTSVFDGATSRAQRRRAALDLDATLWELSRVVELGEGLVEDVALAPARTVLERASQRRRVAPGVTVVALLGATGSGKSTLFNALTGTSLARTAVTRPTTTRPLAAVPAAAAGTSAERVADLLDWLSVDQRAQLERDAGMGTSTVLLDLPDVDSDEPSHRETAARLAELVDVLVWVLDPEKYADAVLHHDFIAPMAAHASVAVVALNQVDRLDPASRAEVTADLARLLASEGLGEVVVEPVSARTAEGVDALRKRIHAVASGTRASEDRLAADVRTAAEVLWRELDLDDRAGAYRGDARAALVPLREAAARAAGVETVATAVAGSMSHQAAGYVGWVPVRWVGRFRKDPLRALHLGADVVRGRVPDSSRRVGAEAVDPQGGLVQTTARTSLPEAGAVASGALRSAAHTAAVRLAGDLPGDAEADLVARSDARVSALAPALDAAVARTDLEQRRVPSWWRVANALQWLLALTALVGGAWLLALHLMERYLLMEAEPPRWGQAPWPVLLLVGGLVSGLVLAVVGTLLARVGAHRRERRVRARLRAATDEVVEREVIAPITADLARWTDLTQALTRLR